MGTVCLADSPRVELIAHRGASYDAPENTVAAFKLAWKQLADGAECDLYLTADKKIVACHDQSLKRTAGIDRLIAECTLEEIRKLDAGSWKNSEFAGEKVPTLGELLAVIPPGKKVYLEVKCGPEIVPELIRELKANGKPARETPVICFQADVVAAVKQQAPELPAYLLHSLKKISADDLIRQAKAVHADGVDVKFCPELTTELAARVREAGLRLDVWTVNEPVDAARAISLGVQGITTDRPAFLREETDGLQSFPGDQ